MIPTIIPDALTIAVTSGKGGVGKTTTAVAVAAALASRGVDVVLVDGDVEGPNVHIVASMATEELGVDRDTCSLALPVSELGFRVASPTHLTAPFVGAPGFKDLVSLVRFAQPPDCVVVDLPPGWTDSHKELCMLRPDVVVAVVAPTEAALADHARHLDSWQDTWSRSNDRIRNADRRRKVALAESPRHLVVETMARVSGTDEGTGQVVTIRRLDALAPDVMATRADPAVSLPAAASIEALVATQELQQLVDEVAAVVREDAVPG